MERALLPLLWLGETPTVWPHTQDGGQQEAKDTDL